jgi:hypothetical protein
MLLRRTLVLLGSGALALASGCGPAGEHPPPPKTGQVVFSAHSTNATIASVAPEQTLLLVEHLWVSLDALRFYDCQSNEQILIAGRTAVDLARGGSVAFSVNDAAICALTSTFMPAEHPMPADAPGALSGRTVLIQGRRADGASFVLASELTPILRLQGVNEFPLGPGPTNLLLSFDVAAALAGLDMQTALVGSDGFITLDNTNNAALVAAFEEQFVQAISLHVDSDANARVSPTEPAIAKAP